MADESVTLRNVSGFALQVWSASGADGFGVEEDSTVTLPGVIVGESEDAVFIGPPDAPLLIDTDPDNDDDERTEPNPAVRAWPRALWTVATAHHGRAGGRGDRRRAGTGPDVSTEKENTDA